MNHLIRVVALASVLCSYAAKAQDAGLLAKIAFEDAEAFYVKGQWNKALEKLDEAEKLIDRTTPKTQYLRVQIWKDAGEANSNNVGPAITVFQDYINLSGTFELPEEKLKEVIRLKNAFNEKLVAIKAEKERLAEIEAQRLALETELRKLDSTWIAHFRVSLGMSRSQFETNRPDFQKLLKKGTASQSDAATEYYIPWKRNGIGAIEASKAPLGITYVSFNPQDRICRFEEVLLQTKNPDEAAAFLNNLKKQIMKDSNLSAADVKETETGLAISLGSYAEPLSKRRILFVGLAKGEDFTNVYISSHLGHEYWTARF